MLEEMDNDFYCSGNHSSNNLCGLLFDEGSGQFFGCQKQNCIHKNYHRKYPTLKQFKEEYGFEWEGAVYWAYNDGLEWVADDCRNVELMENPSADFVVCACTPFVPSKDWRPE